MEKVKDYLLYLFLLENIAVQTSLMWNFSTYIFYVFLVLGAFLFFQGRIWNINTIRTYWPLYALGGIYVVYEFTIGYSYIDQRSLIYLIAKLTTFIIIITSIDSNFEFYNSRMFKGLIIFMSFFILYALLTDGLSGSASGRMKVGFINENTTSTMGAVILGTVLFITEKWNLKMILLAGIGLFTVLAGGSRGGLFILAILLLLRYGISMKIIFVVGTLYVISSVVFPAIGLDTVGIERFMDTINGKEGSNRDLEREACWMMINERPFTGWGFEAQNQGAALELSELSSHNGYLETLKFMGYPMGGVWIAILLISILKIYSKYRSLNMGFDLYLALLFALAIKAMYEALFVGVHEFGTNVFFVCLAMAYKKTQLIEEEHFYN